MTRPSDPNTAPSYVYNVTISPDTEDGHLINFTEREINKQESSQAYIAQLKENTCLSLYRNVNKRFLVQYNLVGRPLT